MDLALDDRLYIYDNLSLALQELDLLFCTENTELIGDTSVGITLHQFLWTLTPMTESLRKYLDEKLQHLVYLNYFNYNLDIDYISEDYQTKYIIKIQININEDEIITKEYQFK